MIYLSPGVPLVAPVERQMAGKPYARWRFPLKFVVEEPWVMIRKYVVDADNDQDALRRFANMDDDERHSAFNRYNDISGTEDDPWGLLTDYLQEGLVQTTYVSWIDQDQET